MALFPETPRHYFYEGITATSNCQGGVQMTLEARKTKRSTHIVEVEYGGEEMQLSARISDLSIGGIFIDTLRASLQIRGEGLQAARTYRKRSE